MNRVVSNINALLFKDHMILNYSQSRSEKDKVNLHSYHPELQNPTESGTRNLGDALSSVVVSFMLEKRGYSLGTSVSKMRHLYAIGSILLMGYQNATVWGSGFPFEPSMLRGAVHHYPFRRLDVRCVRGPLTKKTMERLGQKCPTIYGDPAVLMPLIYQPQPTDSKLEYLVIPHFSTEETVRSTVSPQNIVSMNTTDYKTVIDKICSAKMVISSSLHGIILAEAYGVPAVFFQDRPERFNYKYADWYGSTGRDNFFVAQSIQEAMSKTGLRVPELKTMQENLINTFPYDLWE